ncbi:hypothetical protein J3R83DRAFT_12296 [Lanmaoa asiatica]|nr:hypothetical protein J3R83DRAFT_12296 [Lanmaoa asiatica]
MVHSRESTAESVGPFGISWSTFLPFSSSALASLPEDTIRPSRYTRQDDITDQVPNYSAIQPVRVPRKVATAIKVEGKVWFANERTWLSWLNAAILIGTFAVALFNASHDPVARGFSYVYAALSVAVLIYGFYLYQSRITMIRKRDPGHYDAITGPLVVSTVLFVAVLANFVIRVHELWVPLSLLSHSLTVSLRSLCSRQQQIPIPGLALLQQIMSNFIPST